VTGLLAPRLVHMGGEVIAAYARRAGEYVEHVGHLAAVHPSDLHLIGEWADRLRGPLIDAGCGPGHWTGYLAERGVDACGVDQVPEFIEHARTNNPGVRFMLGDLGALPNAAGSIAGVLAWYSLIHHEPSALRSALAEFARVLRPGGELLLGFFSGQEVETFQHAVVTAYRWPPHALSAELRVAGFEVVETHTRTGPGYRPHGAIVARMPTSVTTVASLHGEELAGEPIP
jgi:SAM-dependent methyltransferase